MMDSINRQDAIKALWKALYDFEDKMEKQFQESEELDVSDWFQHRIFVQDMNDIDRQSILNLPSVEPEIIRCKDCIHKPWYSYPDDPIENDGFDIIFPDSVCPCQCDDGWYNWMPKDDFYCKRAERRTSDGA